MSNTNGILIAAAIVLTGAGWFASLTPSAPVGTGDVVEFTGLPDAPNAGSPIVVTSVSPDWFRWALTPDGQEQGAITFEYWNSWIEQGGMIFVNGVEV